MFSNGIITMSADFNVADFTIVEITYAIAVIHSATSKDSITIVPEWEAVSDYLYPKSME